MIPDSLLGARQALADRLLHRPQAEPLALRRPLHEVLRREHGARGGRRPQGHPDRVDHPHPLPGTQFNTL